MTLRIALVLAALTIFHAPHALAQNTPPPCDGNYATVRVSTIKPGKMDLFMQAVAAHKSWYRNHGFKDNIIVSARVITRGQEGGASKYSETEVVSLHINAPNTSGGKRDADWDAYVNMYRESSEIKTSYSVCMPKLVP
jgi:hypothetical protein